MIIPTELVMRKIQTNRTIRVVVAMICLAVSMVINLGIAQCNPVGTGKNDGVVGVATVREERLQSLMGRPRLYLQRQRLEQLPVMVEKEPLARVWRLVLDDAEWVASQGRSFRSASPKNKLAPEQLLRRSLDRLPQIAIAYLVTKEVRYLRECERLLAEISGQSDWFGNVDIDAADTVFNVAVTYDWLHDELRPELRNRVGNSLSAHTEILYRLLREGNVWWAKPPLLQNHNYINAMAVGVAAIALYGEVPEADEWLHVVQKNFLHVLESLSSDGASHEGVSYWSTGTAAIIKYFLAAENIFGLKQIKDNSFFKNTAAYRRHASLPDYIDNVDYADSHRYDFQGPSYMLHMLARLFNDGYAQWLANEIAANRKQERGNYWLDLAWYDENIGAENPTDQPTSRLFENLGILFSRDSWKQGAFWAFFKAGPTQGWDAFKKGDYVGSHVHPDSGNYLLWAKGRWVIIDDGYVIKKKSSNHSVLTFSEMGQLGEGGKWFRKDPVEKNQGKARITHSEINAKFQYIVARLEGIYPKESGINFWERTFISLPGHAIVVRDSFQMSSPGEVTSRIHAAMGAYQKDTGRICLGDDIAYELVTLVPDGWKVNLAHHVIPESERRPEKSERILITQSGSKVQDGEIINVIMEAGKPCGVGDVRLTKTGPHQLAFRSAGMAVSVNFATFAVQVSAIR